MRGRRTMLLLLLASFALGQQDTVTLTRQPYLVVATPGAPLGGLCATYAADFSQFRPVWDTYSGSELFVSPALEPLTSWQPQGLSQHRSYLLAGEAYDVTFRERPRGLANLVVFRHGEGEDARTWTQRMLLYLESQETPCLLQAGEALFPTDRVQAGDLLEVAVTLRNTASFAAQAGTIAVRAPVPNGTRYLPGSARSDAEQYLLEVSLDGQSYQELNAELESSPVVLFRFGLLEPLEPGEERKFWFRTQVE